MLKGINIKMKEKLVIAIIDLALAVLMGVFAVLNFCDGDIVHGVTEAVLCIINLILSISYYQKYRKIRLLNKH